MTQILKPIYQYRPHNQGSWTDCNEMVFNFYSRSLHAETRTLYAKI